MPREFRTVVEALAYFAECELATLGHLEVTSRPSKSELRRHETLSKMMLDSCKQFGVDRETCRLLGCVRVFASLFPGEAMH